MLRLERMIIDSILCATCGVASRVGILIARAIACMTGHDSASPLQDKPRLVLPPNDGVFRSTTCGIVKKPLAVACKTQL